MFVIPHLLLVGSFAFISQTAPREMRVYSYLSPAAKKWLDGIQLSNKDLEAAAVLGLRTRSIKPFDDNALYEGSEDTFRIDLRRSPKGLVIELSVRQGASIHNMLQRWRGTRVQPLQLDQASEAARSSLFKAISELLDNLKANYESPAYKQGSMVEE